MRRDRKSFLRFLIEDNEFAAQLFCHLPAADFFEERSTAFRSAEKQKNRKTPTGTPLEAFCSRLPVKGLAAAIIPQDRSPNTREMYCGLYMAGSE